MRDLVLKLVVLVGVIAFLSMIMAFPVMWLWNWVVPSIFGLTKIAWTQALGLSLLTSLLFKSSAASSKD